MCGEFGLVIFFVKQKTAYEMRISDWSSDVCSSDLVVDGVGLRRQPRDDGRGRSAQASGFGHRDGPHPRRHRRAGLRAGLDHRRGDRQSVVEGTSVSVRVDLVGSRYIKKKNVYSSDNPSNTETTTTNDSTDDK